MNLKELKEKLQKALVDAKAICEGAEKAGRDFTAEERTQVSALLEEAGKIKGQIKAAEGDEALKKMVLDLGAGFNLNEGGRMSQPGGAPAEKGTIGERFVNAPAFKAWMDQVAPGGHFPDGMKRFSSPPVEFKTLITGDSDTSAGAFVQTDYTGIYEPLGRQELNIMGLIARRRTQSDLVEFVRQTAKVTQATPVAEANVTTYAGSTGEVEGEKPEGALAFEKVTATVKTIAVWVPATKRALSDASQIRGIIDQELQADIMEELADQIVNGDGTGENFTGILETAGILTQAWDTDLLTTTRKAKTALRVTGRATPTAFAFNPADWETIELLQDGSNRYYWGGPLMNGEKRLWGVPVVEDETVPEGTGILADWRKAVLWDRERASLQVSDSHADFFIRNMVAFLAEMRAAFGLIRPSAFIEIDLTSGS